ncbi:MAG: hypothetical protein K9W44_01280 [Candidatus Lokiarchaeota archaeon]|nr:hypothetical protein [Candidatus Harpocratesius repetitus]
MAFKGIKDTESNAYCRHNILIHAIKNNHSQKDWIKCFEDLQDILDKNTNGTHIPMQAYEQSVGSVDALLIGMNVGSINFTEMIDVYPLVDIEDMQIIDFIPADKSDKYHLYEDQFLY